ncbi:Aste57867_14770 [Aphanomyces stellatus]|uniref:Centrosomal protein of 19 kDa n=1 Tax=Aphanomyces stellatus TaxID=120398 RepID=A0A485L2D2_9STRA|nr:hypothetical protein As57867_014715 [Aphanomyces stellatus]VFT91588.1 Aste57867_14770 [Aphanomyces stellatus]
MEPQRLGVRYAPAMLTVEFQCNKKLYLHEIAMETYLSRHSEAASLVRQLQQDHAAYLDDVSTAQLTRVVQKLFQKAKPLASLPIADYNAVSETQLRLVKEKMDTIFTANILKPGDPGYEYDKQVEFQPTETTDWDD